MNFLHHPLVFLKYALEGKKTIYLLQLFGSLLFLPVLSPLLLIAILPQLTQNLLSRYMYGASLMKHYTAPMIPFLFYATLRGFARLSEWKRFPRENPMVAKRLVCLFLILFCIIFTFRSEVFQRIFLGERSPSETLHYLSKKELKEAERLGGIVPDDASFAVSGHLAKYFARRKVICFVNAGFIRIFPFDFILYFAKSPEHDIFQKDPELMRLRDKQYELVEKSGRLFLYRRRPGTVTTDQKRLLDGVPE